MVLRIACSNKQPPFLYRVSSTKMPPGASEYFCSNKWTWGTFSLLSSLSGEYLALKLNSPQLFGVFFTSSGDALTLSRLVNFLTEFFGALRRFVLSFYYFTLQSFPCFINDHKFSSFTRDQKWGQRFHRKAASLKDGNGAFYSKTCGSNV